MEKTSRKIETVRRGEELHLRLPDDKILVLRRIGENTAPNAILIIPAFGETIQSYGALGTALYRASRAAVYLLDLRGHGASEGRWSVAKEKTDILFVAGLLREYYKKMYIVAKGLSASIVAQVEDSLSVDGIVLLEPTNTIKRSRSVQMEHGHQAKQKPMTSRVQTPTTVFSSDHHFLKAVQGNVKLHHAKWTHAMTPVETADQANKILHALEDVHEQPIRF